MKSFAAGFYNTENFFDTENDPDKFDDEYTPEGEMNWTPQKYHAKVSKISDVISRIGIKETGEPPVFIGLAEVENSKVLNDLISAKKLAKYNYSFAHFESRDERGVDNAILYRKDLISLIEAKPIKNTFPRANSSPNYTRDTLFVKFNFNGHEINTFTIHLPSKNGNEDPNRDFRNSILTNIRNETDKILKENPEALIIIMGDFNSNPDENAREILKTTGKTKFSDDELHNPMFALAGGDWGTTQYNNEWIWFDQMLFSKGFFSNHLKTVQFFSFKIFKETVVTILR